MVAAMIKIDLISRLPQWQTPLAQTMHDLTLR
jgi:hypothetical protein